MALHKIKKGLDLPITGAPRQEIGERHVPRHVALLAADYHGMRPTMSVEVGDGVRLGQKLFDDKKTAGVSFTSPGSGRVVAIHRGERRAFQSIVIELDRSGDDAVPLSSFAGTHPSRMSRDEARGLLLESGLWTALRARPFGRVAGPARTPRSIFVTAMDSNPLAASVDVVMEGQQDAFGNGLRLLGKLTDGPVFVCSAEQSRVETPREDQIRHERFAGPHPAGTVGVHIHRLDPVDRRKLVWHLGYQDVIAIGKLATTGEIDPERVVSLAGPPVKEPRLYRTRLGASLDDLVEGRLADGESRVISGSVLSGREAMGDVHGYLGRFHSQVSALREDRERHFLGWLAPGFDRFSIVSTFASALVPGRQFDLTSSTHGSPRAIVPIGMYERVMAMDILPTFLLRALVMGDLEKAEELGCLELEEEDVSLLSFVCPGKQEYGGHLRSVLERLEKEG